MGKPTNKQEIKNLQEKVTELENEIKELNDPYIGEVYSKVRGYRPLRHWIKIKESSTIDEVNGYVKLRLFHRYEEEEVWVEKEDIVFYDDSYKSLKEAVEVRTKRNRHK